MRVVLVLLCVVSGCAAQRVEVRTEAFELADTRGVLRLDPALVCQAEPRFLLDDVSSVNGALRAFVRRVPRRAPSEWTDDELEFLTRTLETLPHVLESHGAVVAELATCAFAKTGAWPELRERAAALLLEARGHLEGLPDGLRAARRARALAAWRQELAANAEAARRACTPRNRTTVYVAWREGERTTWRFCDGAEASSERGGAPRLETALIRGKPLPARVYLDALSRFPRDALQTAPGEDEVSAW